MVIVINLSMQLYGYLSSLNDSNNDDNLQKTSLKIELTELWNQNVTIANEPKSMQNSVNTSTMAIVISMVVFFTITFTLVSYICKHKPIRKNNDPIHFVSYHKIAPDDNLKSIYDIGGPVEKRGISWLLQDI